MTKQVITTNDVTIKQEVVEVKVLKIGKRQVTQAVFKQLLKEPIIDPNTGELLGEAWGSVNYHPDCTLSGKHVHVVWRKGNELRRAVEYIDASRNKGYSELVKEVEALSYQYVITRILEGSVEPLNIYPALPCSPYDDIKTVNLYLVPFDETITVRLRGNEFYAWPELNNERARERLEKERRVGTWSSEQLFDRLSDTICARNTYGNVLVRSYDHLEQLEQLFIAV